VESLGPEPREQQISPSIWPYTQKGLHTACSSDRRGNRLP
jgi:hypothetical protein